MKIVLLADSISSQNSGIHYFGKQFIQRLFDHFPQHEFHIIATKRLDNFEVNQTIIPVKNLPLHLRWRQFTSVPKAIRKLNPDLVIELAHFGPFRLSSNIKRATIIHDLTPLKFPKFNGYLSWLMHKVLLPGIVKKADHLIVNSICTKKDTLEQYPKSVDKINIIYPHLEIPSQDQISKINLPGKYILSVGTIEPRKNYELLIQAFQDLANKDEDLSLVIVGKKGWKMDHFDQLINEHPYKDRIFIAGYVDRSDLWHYYQHAKLFVFPSNYEGFGIPVLEAMYHSLPLLLSDIPTSKEIAGDAALYFNKEDKGQLVELASNLIEDEEKLNSLHLKSQKQYEKIIQLSDQQLIEWMEGLTKGVK